MQGKLLPENLRSGKCPSGNIPIAVNQSVHKNARAFGSEPKGWAFRQSSFAETLGFCAFLSARFSDNPRTDTTFLLRSPKTEKEQSLTN